MDKLEIKKEVHEVCKYEDYNEEVENKLLEKMEDSLNYLSIEDKKRFIWLVGFRIKALMFNKSSVNEAIASAFKSAKEAMLDE